MKFLIRTIHRRPRGNAVNSDEIIEIDADAPLRLGRGTNNQIHLDDLRVLYYHARMRIGNNTLQVDSEPGADVRVNNAPVAGAAIGADDVLDLGPFRLRLILNDPGADIGLSIELVVPQSDEEARLLNEATTKVGLKKALPGRRPMAWALALAVTGLCLILPIAAHFINPAVRIDPNIVGSISQIRQILPFGDYWKVGTISAAHKSFGSNCTLCHTAPFQPVADQGCLQCHGEIQHHVSLTNGKNLKSPPQACTSCHQEHEGAKGIAQSNPTLCTTCHENIKDKAPDTHLANVSGFSQGKHPQFHLTVAMDARGQEFQRVALDANPPPARRTNLKFSHEDHLKPHEKKGPWVDKVLGCVDCHQANGNGFQPVRMEEHCQSCHQLSFNPLAPMRHLPHGNTRQVREAVRDYFQSVVLEGNYPSLIAPAIVRRLPGTPLKPEQRAEGLEWAELMIDKTIAQLADRNGCGECHVAKAAMTDTGAALSIAPVFINQPILPNAVFDHSAHKGTDCQGCHQAKTTKSLEDAMVPPIEQCMTCHGDANATDKTPSPCISCHVFHNPKLPAMHPHQEAVK